MKIYCGSGVYIEITQPKGRYTCREAHIHNNMDKVVVTPLKNDSRRTEVRG